ncbi:MAG: general secretion pathway protein GspE, partial [Nitrospirae bacterium]|nr:general secretion pathway protein GspE [Nitrospirota bacterium]
MSSKKRLGEILLEAKRIDHVHLQAALGHQRRWGGKLGS